MVSIIFGELHTTMLNFWVLIWQQCINLLCPSGHHPRSTLILLIHIKCLPNCLSNFNSRMYADDMQTYSGSDQRLYPHCFPIGDNDLVLGLNRLQLRNHWDYLASKSSQHNTSYNLGTPRKNLIFDYHAQIIWNSLSCKKVHRVPRVLQTRH